MATRATRRDVPRPARYAILGLLGGILIFAAFMIVRSRGNDTLVLEVGTATDPNEIRVYVGGAVTAPGLYTLPRGSRVAEAVEAAGGLLPDADTTGLGMAAPLEDADQIIVAAAQVLPQSPPTTQEPSENASTPVPLVGNVSERINVNSATQAELESLPGIGPVIAARIIEHRSENGPFQTIDELESIQGISADMVEELRQFVTVGP